jgi:uncharacterized protein (DUF433 family)
MESYSGLVEERPDRNGGYPVLTRLNISVRVIVEMSRAVGDFAELCATYTQCTPQELRAALDYYRDHPQRVNEDIERNQRAWEEVVSGQWQARGFPSTSTRTSPSP